MSKSVEVTIGFINGGRGRKPIVEKMWGIASKVAKRNKIDYFVAVEVNEGDKGYNDAEIIKRKFSKFRMLLSRKREVLLTGSDVEVGRKRAIRTIKAGGGVPKLSPARPAHVVDSKIESAEIRTVFTHLHAGTHNQAHNRSAAAAEKLTREWEKTADAVVAASIGGLASGKVVQIFLDANMRGFNVWLMKRMHGHYYDAAVLFNKSPDFGFVFTPNGIKVKRTESETFANPLEPGTHPGHVASYILSS